MSEQSEFIVAGAAIDNCNAVMGELSSKISAEMFTNTIAGAAFNTAKEMWVSGSAVDRTTIIQRMLSKSVIDNHGATVVLGFPATQSDRAIKSHTAILIDSFRRRHMAKVGQMLMDAASGAGDVEEISESAHSTLHSIFAKSAATRGTEDVVMELMGLMEYRMKVASDAGDEPIVTGIPTGFRQLDRMTQGWQKGQLIIIAGRPSMGKSTIAMNMSLVALPNTWSGRMYPRAKRFKRIFFTFETRDTANMSSAACYIAGIEHRLIKERPTMDAIKRVGDIIPLLEDWHIIDNCNPTVASVNSVLYRLLKPGDDALVVIDYLQLMNSPGSGSRENEVSEISRDLKLMAKNFDIAVIALSQLSRAVETRGGDKKPKLSDLRESGSIEQDADMVIFPYRASYYGLQVYDDGESTHGAAELIIAKQREGEVNLDGIRVAFRGGYGFHDLGMQPPWDCYSSTDDFNSLGPPRTRLPEPQMNFDEFDHPNAHDDSPF